MADNFQLKAIISAVDKITPVLKGVARSVKITHKALRDIGTAGGELMRKVGIPAALSFGAVAYGAINATRAALDFAGGIQDAAERTGASTGDYQTLVNMLGEVGGSAEDAETMFTKFNKGIAEGAAGVDKNFAGLMKKLKIPLKDANGNLRSLTDVMPELADAFAKNEDPATRSRMALELWGKSGTKMIPIMIRGGAAFNALAAEQERLGGKVSDGAISALDNMGDSIGFVGKQIRTQWTEAVAKMVPVITPLIKHLTEWIAKNKELIQTTIVDVLTGVAAAIKEVDWVAFIKGVKDTVNSVREFVAEVGGMKNIVIGLGLAWVAGPVAAVMSIGGAVARAIVSLSMLLFSVKSTATGYTVMGAIPAINAALGASFVWLRTQALAAMLVLRMGGVAGLATVALQSIMAGVAATGTALMGAGKAVLLFSRALLLSPLGIVMALATAAYLIYENWDTLKKWFSEFTDWIGQKFTQIAKWAKDLVPDWVHNLFGGGGTNLNISQTAMPGIAAARDIVAPAAAPGLAAPRTSTLVAGSQPRINGEMTVRFENSPPGMRVDQGKTNQPGMLFNPDVGYRSLGAAL